jgi:hypothetical protein
MHFFAELPAPSSSVQAHREQENVVLTEALSVQLRGHANIVSISNLVVKTRMEFDAALNRERIVTDAHLVTDLMMTDLSKMMDHAYVFTEAQVLLLSFPLPAIIPSALSGLIRRARQSTHLRKPFRSR